MGNKRKQDHDSSSSDAKRRRSCHCHNGDASRPSDEGFSLRDAVNELKDVIQVKERTKEKFKREIKKLKEKRKKDKNKHEEDLRMLKEDLIRIFKEDQQELKLQIQEMRKDGCAEVNHHEASPSQRSQLSQSKLFRLKIENSMKKTIYKKENVETEDGGGRIKVVMYDGDNRIASDHPLASVRVDLVVIKGGFNESKPMPVSWSKEEFEKNIVQPREGIKRLVENGTFDLVDGSCDHEGAIIMDNSQQREVKFGVMIAVPTETRVLEGVSNPFKVQEGKTKKSEPNKKRKKSSAAPTGKLVEPTSNNETQHDQGPVSTDVQHCFPPPVIQDVLQKAVSLPRNFQDRGNNTEFLTDGSPEDNRPATAPLMVEENGQALNGNGQQSCQQIPTQISWLPTSTHSMQHGQDYSLPSTSIQNPFQAAGYCGQVQYTSFPDASYQLAFPDLYGSFNDFREWTSTPAELGHPSQSIGEVYVQDVPNLNVRAQIQETYGSFICGRVLLRWDKPHMELKKHWNFLDQLMPLYSTQSRFYGESSPSASLMDKARKLLASISSGGSILKMVANFTSQAIQTPQRRGVLIRPMEPYDSDNGPPAKKQKNAKYQLRFVNRVCNVYFTQEQIKSEDGNPLKVALYDENNFVVTSGPLSSAFVEFRLVHGDFNAEDQSYWTSEDFSACLVHPQSLKESPALGGDCVSALTDGVADLGNVYFHTSSFHARTGKFKMGVEIKNVREEGVQEGITGPFIVMIRLEEESSCHQTTPHEADKDNEWYSRYSVDDFAQRMRKPRLVWTPQLHKRFVEVVAHLGIKSAVPRTIIQLMNKDNGNSAESAGAQLMDVKGLTRENVARHLQKYRLYLKRVQGLSHDGPTPDDHLFASTPVPHSFWKPQVPHAPTLYQQQHSGHAVYNGCGGQEQKEEDPSNSGLQRAEATPQPSLS